MLISAQPPTWELSYITQVFTGVNQLSFDAQLPDELIVCRRDPYLSINDDPIGL